MKTYDLCDIISIYRLPYKYISSHISENKDSFPSLTIATRGFSSKYFCCKFENVAVPYILSHPSPVYAVMSGGLASLNDL